MVPLFPAGIRRDESLSAPRPSSGANRHLTKAHKLAKGPMFFRTPEFHDTERRLLNRLIRKYGPEVPREEWDVADRLRAVHPKASLWGKFHKEGTVTGDGDVACLFPPGFYAEVPPPLVRPISN